MKRMRLFSGDIKNKSTKEISNNTLELQKNVFNTYQSPYVQFLDNIYKSWENFKIPERYAETYDTLNKNVQEYTVNSINFVNEIVVGGIENFNRTIEPSLRYYSDIMQNTFNYTRKIESICSR